jgi:hypothetical protein
MMSDEYLVTNNVGELTVLLVELEVVEGTSEEDEDVDVGASVVVGTGADVDVDVGSAPPMAAAMKVSCCSSPIA